MKKNKAATTPNTELSRPANIAVLVDGENISASTLTKVLEFASRYGQATIRRLYADWSQPATQKWKEPARELSFRPIEALSHVKGKNTTDVVLVIDAMDLLYSENIDGFCIASSDSDYAPLAQRIREQGLLVIGCGESKTPAAFVNSCKKFLFLDQENGGKDKMVIQSAAPKADTPDVILKKEAHIFDQAFDIIGKEEVTLSQLGTELKKIFPKYKPRRYGCKTLGHIYLKLDKYEVIQTGIKGIYNTVRLKGNPQTLG